jgi:hypothetical protein
MGMKYALCLLILLATSMAARGEDFVVIGNASLTDRRISASDLKQIYLGTKTSLDGRHVEPVIAQSGPFHEQFVSVCLGKTEAGLRNYFRNLVFSGKGNMPRSFATSAEVVSFVSRTPGAIGYVDSEANLTGVTKLTVH